MLAKKEIVFTRQDVLDIYDKYHIKNHLLISKCPVAYLNMFNIREVQMIENTIEDSCKLIIIVDTLFNTN